jgi:tyrosine-protein phosphatase YwqE
MQDTSTTTAPAADGMLRHKLRRASTESLIQAVIQLTHRVHGRHDAIADRIREQREHVISEIKRRADSDVTGGAA